MPEQKQNAFGDIDPEFGELLEAARGGSTQALDELVGRYRDYLCLIANERLDPELRVKAAASDVVQESLLAAQRDLGGFRGKSQAEWVAWLKTILVHELLKTNRAYRGTAKRQLSREHLIDAQESAQIAHHGLTDPGETPGTEALSLERSRELASAIGRLPENYRQVIRLRNWEQLTFEEIGKQLERSPDAVRKLWSRAIDRLRNEYSGGQ